MCRLQARPVVGYEAGGALAGDFLSSGTAMIDWAINGGVALITLAGPPSNGFTLESLSHLQRLLEALSGDALVKAVVITGQGDEFFSVGTKVPGLAQIAQAPDGAARERFERVQEALKAARPLTVAAINGDACGDGAFCALACDHRIAEEQAVLALSGVAGPMAHPLQIGAFGALRSGLIERVVPKGMALEAALEMARRVRGLSAEEIRLFKNALRVAQRDRATRNDPHASMQRA